jgi:hypothetical protein
VASTLAETIGQGSTTEASSKDVQQQQNQVSGPAAAQLTPEPEHVQATSRVLRQLLMTRLQTSFKKLTVSLLMGVDDGGGEPGSPGPATPPVGGGAVVPAVGAAVQLSPPGREPGPSTSHIPTSTQGLPGAVSSVGDGACAGAQHAGHVMQAEAVGTQVAQDDDQQQQGTGTSPSRAQPTAVLNAVLHAQLLRTLMAIAYHKPHQSSAGSGNT